MTEKQLRQAERAFRRDFPCPPSRREREKAFQDSVSKTETQKEIEYLRQKAQREGKPLCMGTMVMLAKKRRNEMEGGRFLRTIVKWTDETPKEGKV